MTETTYHQGKRETILNRAMEYYENDKERLREPARNKYRELSEEEKNKREYSRNRYHNMSEEKRQKLKAYQKIIVRLRNLNLVINKFNSVCYDLVMCC